MVLLQDAFATTNRDAFQVILGGSRVDLLTRAEVFREINRSLLSGTPLAVASANLDHIHHFGCVGESREAFDQGMIRWINLLDGAPLAVRARQITGARWQRQAGSDLLEPILDRLEFAGRSIGFLGGTSATHTRLRTRLAESHPDLRVVGYWNPNRAQLDDPDASRRIADRIRRSRAELLVVGLGKPRQELWIERHWRATGATVLLAFGASTDFLAGAIERAPKPFRATGTEWLYRLAREPRRLRQRYLSDGPRALRCLVHHSHPMDYSPLRPVIRHRPGRTKRANPPDRP